MLFFFTNFYQIHVLNWWQTNEIRFPTLAKMAQIYLSIMATSAPIESQFSIFGNIITKNRNSLKKDTAKRLVLLKSWKVPEITMDEPETEDENIDDESDINLFDEE